MRLPIRAKALRNTNYVMVQTEKVMTNVSHTKKKGYQLLEFGTYIAEKPMAATLSIILQQAILG